MTTPALAYNAPTSLLSANDRDGWRVRSGKIKRWRTATAAQALAAKHPAAPIPCRIVVVVHRSHNRGRFDAGNYQPTAKAIVDGLVDARVLVDDANAYVTGPDVRPGNPWPKAGVEVHVLGPHQLDPPTITDPPAGDPLWTT